MNFLEELTLEWYAYKGHFVRSNIRLSKRKEGGYSREIDVAAINPQKSILVHIETSMSAEAWSKIRNQLRKKFSVSKTDYESTLSFQFNRIEKLAIVGYSKAQQQRKRVDDITLVSIPMFVREIAEKLRKIDPLRRAVPENYPLLRAVQYAVHWGQLKS